jgi:DNA-binding LacI/PurR family transcriptional regulator
MSPAANYFEAISHDAAGRCVSLYQLSLFNRNLEPFFKKALSNSAIAAWVGSNNFVGMLMLEFPKKHSIAVPSTVAVASFDDSREALQYELSSYNFDFPGIARKALAYIMFPSNRAITRNGPLIEVEGMLIVRSSPAKAKSKQAQIPP